MDPFWLPGGCRHMARLRNILALMRAQLWLVPALMTAFAAALAVIAVTYGGVLQRAAGESAWWLYSGDASTARDLLGAFLAGLLTMTSLVVSVTVVVLATAASQLGPRLITYFMGDRQIQFVIGLFIATTFYIIIVLRTLDDALGPDGIPHAAVTLASALTTACLFALLFYVHKMARSIIADNLVREVWVALRSDIDQIIDDEMCEEAGPVSFEKMNSRTISLHHSGYVQLVDYEALIRIAERHDVYLKVDVRAGHYVLASAGHVQVCGEDAPGRNQPTHYDYDPKGSRRAAQENGDGKLDKAIADAVVIGSDRTPAQDLEHGLRQLVEVGLRALSPGINDAFTGIAVIDRLGAALEVIFRRPLPSRFLTGEDGRVRVIATRSDHEGLVGAAFNQIRQAGASQPAIVIRIAQILGQLGASAQSMTARAALLDQIARLQETVEQAGFTSADHEDASAAIAAARRRVSVQPLAGAVP